jgi:hypothetical protein
VRNLFEAHKAPRENKESREDKRRSMSIDSAVEERASSDARSLQIVVPIEMARPNEPILRKRWGWSVRKTNAL